jgi:hypothetical protein
MSSTIFFSFSFQNCITQHFITCLSVVVGQLTFFNKIYKMKITSQPLNALKEGPFVSNQGSFSPIKQVSKNPDICCFFFFSFFCFFFITNICYFPLTNISNSRASKYLFHVTLWKVINSLPFTRKCDKGTGTSMPQFLV